ncbi:MAG: CPBP family intramembrane metalloprotease [Candidatus Micrarchaeota archaeon]|nr:CPBP family intramembrane metalloprotease [Candidatus Micrarchaeota archaeon]
MFYSNGSLAQDTANFYLTAAISLLFPFGAFSYMIHRGVRPREIVGAIGLGRGKLTLNIIGIGLVVFFALFALELLVNLASTVSNTPIDTNVSLLLQNAPLWFLVFTAVIAPINEEIFFRGFLVPRIGIIFSAIIFGLLHASYNSTFGVEIIAAFIFGSIAGYVFRKSGSLYPSIIAHIMINSLAVIAFIAVV